MLHISVYYCTVYTMYSLFFTGALHCTDAYVVGTGEYVISLCSETFTSSNNRSFVAQLASAFDC